MKIIKNLVIVACFILIILISNFTYAYTDQFGVYISREISNDYSGEIYAARDIAVIAEKVFRNNLHYSNYNGSGEYVTSDDGSDFKAYINYPGKNYALVTVSHGDDGAISMGKVNGVTQRFTYNNNTISGYWHLIFLNHCYSMKTDKLAQAFNTIGYSNRGALGWSNEFNGIAIKHWWGCYEKYAGKYSLSEAAVKAANDCIDTPYDTPIRAYGDKYNWNGIAW